MLEPSDGSIRYLAEVVRQSIEQRWIDHLDKHTNEERERSRAKTEQDRRLDSMNEVREQLKTQVPLDYFNSEMRRVTDRISSQERLTWLAMGGIALAAFISQFLR
jgi:hypothetical protein